MAARAIDTSRVAELILSRIACAGTNGVALRQIQGDLRDFVSHRLSEGEWRGAGDMALQILLKDGLIKAKTETRFLATVKGKKSVKEAFGPAADAVEDWAEFCDVILIAKALRLGAKSLKALKPLQSAERLRSAILKSTYHLPIKREVPTVAEVRTALAVRAMEKSYDETLSRKFSARTKLPEKIAVFLGSRLLRRPRELSSTNELFTWLAAEGLEVPQRDPKSLRLALVRSLLDPEEPAPAAKPDDLLGFAHAITCLAKPRATGWPGNKRAYISHVWEGLRDERPDWGLDEGEFKNLLAEAHRAGHLTLQIADLRTKDNIGDIQASVTKYKNNEWHLIRVED